ncbi:MAG: hypothetical protein ACWA40_01465 [Planktomarina sp.]
MDRVIQMALRMLMNYVMRKGINKGVDLASRGRPNQSNPNTPAPSQSPQHQQKIRQAARMMRRMGRF